MVDKNRFNGAIWLVTKSSKKKNMWNLLNGNKSYEIRCDFICSTVFLQSPTAQR